MATTPHIRTGVALVAALGFAFTAQHHSTTSKHSGPELDADEIGLMGNAGHVPDSRKPKLTAFFAHESYRPGDRARLTIADGTPGVTVQFFRAGTETEATIPNDVMLGSPVSALRHIGAVRSVDLHIGNWPSGVYFAQLTSGQRVGYAPFVLGPRHYGEHKVAVVMPTETWQAYNFRDDNGDGTPDTWYAGWHTNHARLVRPFLDRGVPPHWKQYDAPFVRWLVQTHRDVDYLSDQDLRTIRDGKQLAGYNAVIFSGHHEYVTSHEYDVVTQYRNLGGNLAFLAANNFFWKITIRNNVMTRVAQWRDLGRPEAALIGVQYRANDRGGHRGPWILQKGESSAPWLFDGMDVEPGSDISSGGIEIDATAAASPKSVRVLAEIPNLYGPGFTAQMTYYQTPAGAKVFAAGAFSLAGNVWDPDVQALMTNLWSRLSQP
jgi:N,N-dimethylformamidase beta subunit-like protein